MPIFRQPGNTLTAADVLAYAQRVASTGEDVGVNMCQRFVREAFGSGPYGAATASQAWQMTGDKHTAGTPPAGAAVYWGGGAGHTAISAGNGMVYSTDVSSPGKVTLVDMDYITKQWGKPLLGWTGSVGDKKIAKYNAPPVKDGVGGQGDPVYQGNVTTQGGGDATGLSEKQLREKYGYASQLYAQVPEILKLIKDRAKAGWSDDEFKHRVEASKWFRKHTDAERTFVLLSTREPAEAADQVAKKRADVVTMYRSMGVPIAPDRVDKIAKDAVVHAWSTQQLQNALTAEFDYNPKNTYGGVVGQTVDKFRQMAAAYVLPISDKSLESWTDNVLRGEASTDDFASYLKAQATSLHPEMAGAIAQGQTVDDYLSPYRESAASELGIDPSAVDWSDPKWGQAVFQTDDKGARKVMGLADWQKTLRTDDRFGYDKTPGALDQAAQFTRQLGTLFGAA